MALIVVYREGATPQDVLQVIPSAHTPDWLGRTDVLVNPDLSSVLGVAQRYWKVVGTLVEQMTPSEMADVDADIVAALDAAVRSGAKLTWDGQVDLALALRAFADVATDEFNSLRQWLMQFQADVASANNLSDLKASVAALPSLPDRTLAQLKSVLKNKIDNGDVDE